MAESLKVRDDGQTPFAVEETLETYLRKYTGIKLSDQLQVTMQVKIFESQLQSKVLDGQEVVSKYWHRNEVNKKNQLRTNSREKQIVKFQDNVMTEFGMKHRTVSAKLEDSVPLLWTRMGPADPESSKQTEGKSQESFKCGQFFSRQLSKAKKAFSRRFSGSGSNSQASVGEQSRTSSRKTFQAKLATLGKKISRNLQNRPDPSLPTSPSRGDRTPVIDEYGSFLKLNGNDNGVSDKGGATLAELDSEIGAIAGKMSHLERDEQISPNDPGKSFIIFSSPRCRLTKNSRDLKERQGSLPATSPSSGIRTPIIDEYGSFLGNEYGSDSGSDSDKEVMGIAALEAKIEALVRKISHLENGEPTLSKAPSKSSGNGLSPLGKLKKNSRVLEKREGPLTPPTLSQGHYTPIIDENGSFLKSNANECGNDNGDGNGSDKEGRALAELNDEIAAPVRKMSHPENGERSSNNARGNSSFNGSSPRGKLTQAGRNEVLGEPGKKPYSSTLDAQDPKNLVSQLCTVGKYKLAEIDAKPSALKKKIKSRALRRNSSLQKTPQTP